MKRFVLLVLFVMVLGMFGSLAEAQASLTRVSRKHHPATRHHAHKAGRHHRARHSHAV